MDQLVMDAAEIDDPALSERILANYSSTAGMSMFDSRQILFIKFATIICTIFFAEIFNSSPLYDPYTSTKHG